MARRMVEGRRGVEAAVKQQELKAFWETWAHPTKRLPRARFQRSAHWSLARTSCASPQMRMSARRTSRVQPFGRTALGRSPKDLVKLYFDVRLRLCKYDSLLGGIAPTWAVGIESNAYQRVSNSRSSLCDGDSGRHDGRRSGGSRKCSLPIVQLWVKKPQWRS